MEKFLETVPLDSWSEFSAMVKEGKPIIKILLQVALDMADAAARIISSGIAMRRSSWFQALGLPHAVQ